MTTLLQMLQYGPTPSEAMPKANVEIRWKGMRQYPGADWEKYGAPAHTAEAPHGPTWPAVVHGYVAPPVTGYYGPADGGGAPVGTPMTSRAPTLSWYGVGRERPLDLRRGGWDAAQTQQKPWHGDPDVLSSARAVTVTGGSLPRNAVAPRAWSHIAAAQAGQMPPTMEQSYAGVAVADRLSVGAFRTATGNYKVDHGDRGTLVIQSFGIGLLAKVGWIRDLWASKLVQAGAQVDNVYGDGLNKFVVKWSIPTAATGMRQDPITIGLAIIAIIIVLGLSIWLVSKLSLFVEKAGTAAPKLGEGVLLTGLGIAAVLLVSGMAKRQTI